MPFTNGKIHVHIQPFSHLSPHGVWVILWVLIALGDIGWGICWKFSLLTCSLLSLEQCEKGGESFCPWALQWQRKWNFFVWSPQFLLTPGQNASKKPPYSARALGEWQRAPHRGYCLASLQHGTWWPSGGDEELHCFPGPGGWPGQHSGDLKGVRIQAVCGTVLCLPRTTEKSVQFPQNSWWWRDLETEARILLNSNAS